MPGIGSKDAPDGIRRGQGEKQRHDGGEHADVLLVQQLRELLRAPASTSNPRQAGHTLF